jgi:hypothetical protein
MFLLRLLALALPSAHTPILSTTYTIYHHRTRAGVRKYWQQGAAVLKVPPSRPPQAKERGNIRSIAITITDALPRCHYRLQHYSPSTPPPPPPAFLVLVPVDIGQNAKLHAARRRELRTPNSPLLLTVGVTPARGQRGAMRNDR